MNLHESPVVFECEGDQLIGIVTVPDNPSPLGTLIVVGGPQYRVGSHRQFVDLARALAREGYSSFRFDYRGMGDSDGGMRNFEQIETDIHAAARAFRVACPGIERLAAFGLCDAASAVLMAADRIDGLAGMILANPWVRRSETLNAAVVRHYYRERLFSSEFWRKLLSGNLPFRSVATEFFGRVSKLIAPNAGDRSSGGGDFIERMRMGWQLPIKRLLLLSGRDITAREFETLRAADGRWRLYGNVGLLDRELLAEADHTFSSRNERDRTTGVCSRFLTRLANSAEQE